MVVSLDWLWGGLIPLEAIGWKLRTLEQWLASHLALVWILVDHKLQEAQSLSMLGLMLFMLPLVFQLYLQ